jgi:Spy/CpxP family protein refolding chaperone
MQVGLSRGQIDKLKKLHFAVQRAMVATEAKLKSKRIDLHEAMESSAPPSEKKVTALVEKIGRLETELNKKKVLLMLRVRKSMSTDQWHRLRHLHARRRGLASPPPPPSPPRGP